MSDVPLLDEHDITIDASADEVWSALLAALDRSFARPVATAFARVVGCADRTGFHAVRDDPPAELALAGSHHFSSYELRFRIEPIEPDRTRLRAESRATFPGVAGRVYRTLVVGTGFHGRGVRGLLAGIKRTAEA